VTFATEPKKEQEAALFGVGEWIEITAIIQVVADLIDLAAHVEGKGDLSMRRRDRSACSEHERWIRPISPTFIT
jgi:hypothetical protein